MFVAVQQPTIRLNQNATCMGDFGKIEIADRLRSRSPGCTAGPLIHFAPSAAPSWGFKHA
jgi:hypothetical protein